MFGNKGGVCGRVNITVKSVQHQCQHRIRTYLGLQQDIHFLHQCNMFVSLHGFDFTLHLLDNCLLAFDLLRSDVYQE